MRRLLALGLVTAPLVTGTIVMWLGGAPAARWGGHLAAGAIGLCVYAAIAWAPRWLDQVLPAAAVAGVVAIACTLLAPGLHDVHRWLVASGLRLHASQLVAPGLTVFMATNLRRSPGLAAGLLLAIQGLHLVQPDAGQATAVAAGSLVVFLGDPSSKLSRACAAASVAVAIATWTRFDPLAPAPFVEDVVQRAFAISKPLGCVGVIALAAAALAPLTLAHNQAAPEFALARRGLTVYFATAAAVSAFGEFPVPLLGFGASSVLGAFLGLAVLRRAAVS
jgi:cell division protein FtsW (lipid II flippase)